MDPCVHFATTMSGGSLQLAAAAQRLTIPSGTSRTVTGDYRGFELNASKSSAIYGNSATVQPTAVQTLVAIRYWPNITGGSTYGLYFRTENEGLKGPINVFSGTTGNIGIVSSAFSDNNEPHHLQGFDFALSRDNSIYGNSSTVQPQAVRTLVAIRY